MHRAAVEQLYVRYGPMVLRRARALLREDQAARDAVQEVFIRALRALRTQPELARVFERATHAPASPPAAEPSEASPATWLYRITTNYCLNARRDGARRVELWSQHGEREETSTTAGGFARVQLAQIFASISPDLVEIAHYYLVDELTHEEIAALLGVSRRTIGNRLDELRAAVRRLDPLSEAS